jgi:pyruvate dehydrogenase E2 component (dihydrolipoamide acetyltransferase)
MATIVRMPEVLAGMADAVLNEWRAQPGDTLEEGTPLAEIETDKAVVEYAVESAGVLAQLLVSAGETIDVGAPIAVLAETGESIDDAIRLAGTAESKPPTTSSDSVAPSQTQSEEATDHPADDTKSPQQLRSRLFASPLVRKLAAEQGIDLNSVRGSGPRGRVVKRDIIDLPLPKAAAEEKEAAQAGRTDSAAPMEKPTSASTSVGRSPQPELSASTGYTDRPISRMRRAIAAGLTESKTTVPHFYLQADCRVDALLELRNSVNVAATRKASLNDFVVKAAATAFVEVPAANAIWTGEAIRRFEAIDIAVAVALDDGLVTPVVRDVGAKSITTVSGEIAEMAARGREGKLRQHELVGGAFCISYLGMYGTERLTAIINPPQSGILAVGAATQRAVVVEGELAVATIISVTLSADHRVYDGALGAQWLAAFVRTIENPLRILL